MSYGSARSVDLATSLFHVHSDGEEDHARAQLFRSDVAGCVWCYFPVYLPVHRLGLMVPGLWESENLRLMSVRLDYTLLRFETSSKLGYNLYLLL